MAKASILRERGELDQAEELFDAALRIAAERGDPETESWTRGAKAIMLSLRGDDHEAVALAERNYELTERIGDVFSRTWALVNLTVVRLDRDPAGALDAIERAERLYREAMGRGGEAEAWRAGLHAQALLGVGRTSEALARAEEAAAIGRERGMRWSLPRALRTLGEARAAAGEPGAEEALDEAAKVAEETGSAVELELIERSRDTVRAGLA
jgi:tetratricopeptide (TPR) repeat protein